MWSDGMNKKEVMQKTASEKATKVASRIYDENLLDPKAYGGIDTNGRAQRSGSRLFNASGELNASSKADAITQLQHFAAMREKYRVAHNKPYYTEEEKQQIVQAALSGSPEERLRFGSEMIPLVLDRLDYEGFIRQVFRTHNLAQGQVNSYEKDINVTALVTNEDGQTIGSQVRGNRVFPPEFLVTAQPKITVSEIAQRQFDVVERTHDKTTFQIMLTEDRQGLKSLYGAAALENDIINVTSTVSKSVLETLQYEVERHRLQVDKFLMNRQELGDLKKNVNAIDFDPITSRDLLLTGVFGSIWGVNVYVTAGVDEQGLENVSVPAGMIFAVTEGRYLGAMPVRVELSVFPADQFVFGYPSYGWLFLEQISQVVLNPRAIACAIKSSATVPSWMA
jgi:hypothetical protein